MVAHTTRRRASRLGAVFFGGVEAGRSKATGTPKTHAKPATLVTWETYELSKGTPFTALYERLTKLQAEALMWCLQDRASVAQSCTTDRRITEDVNG